MLSAVSPKSCNSSMGHGIPNDAAEFICHEQQQFEQLSHCRWALELKSDRQLIGFCGLRPLHDLHQLEIGWRLHSDFWRCRG